MSPQLITSRQNPRVKDVVGLRAGRERRRSGRHVIDGIREISRALAAGIRPLEAFALVGEAEHGNRELLGLLGQAGAEISLATPEVFAKLCFGQRDAAGVVVVAETPDRRVATLTLPNEPLVAVVEGVEKPGNLGAILRTADAAGLDAVIVADGGSDLFNPNTIRSSLGTVFRPNVVEASADDTISWLRARNLRAFAARPDAAQDYTDVDLRGGVAIVLGSEAEGLTDAWSGVGIEPVRLPMRGIADSLNVSTTAAVLFYEALRQRTTAH